MDLDGRRDVQKIITFSINHRFFLVFRAGRLPIDDCWGSGNPDSSGISDDCILIEWIQRAEGKQKTVFSRQ